MSAESQLELDVRDHAWLENPKDTIRAVLESAPGSVSIAAEEAKAPSAHDAQLLLALRRHVESQGGTFTVSDPSPAFCEGLSLLGLHDPILGTEVVQQ
ncbi:hypothetical protein RGUI_3609 [Rhodovulum sp. P5]|uniref:STAS domain-containing protein n=1 Tax=Rhodovulum sp. P5 TaxID=1564506 RepID=UPI0009C38B4B|nr:STAS domain-containing protein [Rhodovulum sp. P5]ARE41750.1 hypothetical protein RGUI_3609 [Rhodovulum sp. P5]